MDNRAITQLDRTERSDLSDDMFHRLKPVQTSMFQTMFQTDMFHQLKRVQTNMFQAMFQTDMFHQLNAKPANGTFHQLNLNAHGLYSDMAIVGKSGRRVGSARRKGMLSISGY